MMLRKLIVAVGTPLILFALFSLAVSFVQMELWTPLTITDGGKIARALIATATAFTWALCCAPWERTDG